MDRRCDLCSQEIRTTVRDPGDNDYIIVDCLTCHLPMLVWRHHAMTLSAADVRRLEKALDRAGGAYYGDTPYFLDKRQRKIPDHLHWHARPCTPGNLQHRTVHGAITTIGHRYGAPIERFRCVHKIGRGTTDLHSVAGRFDDIYTQGRLLSGNEASVFAYNIEQVPYHCQDWVMVVFDVNSDIVLRQRFPMLNAGGGNGYFEYFEIPTPSGDYRSVDIVGTLNAPGYPGYAGPVGFLEHEMFGLPWK